MGHLVLLEDFANSITRFTLNHRLRVISVAGYPATGKTTLCKRLVDLLGADKAVRLPNETAVYSGARRDRMGIDGASLESIDLDRYQSLAASLLNGEKVQYRDYNRVSHVRNGK